MSCLEKLFPQYTFVTAYSYNLEVNMPAATKGSGLMQLAEILGLERRQVMAFGGGGNDVSMLQSAGVGVAMGNACEEAKGRRLRGPHQQRGRCGSGSGGAGVRRR